MDGIAVVSADIASASVERPVMLGADRFAPIDTGQAVAPRFDAVVPSEQLEFWSDDAVLRAAALRVGEILARARRSAA